MRVVITEPAEQDLLSIQTFIASDSPGRAATFVAELERVCVTMLGANPYIGTSREDIFDGLRILPHGNYVICYQIRDEVVEILHVFRASFDFTRRF